MGNDANTLLFRNGKAGIWKNSVNLIAMHNKCFYTIVSLFFYNRTHLFNMIKIIKNKNSFYFDATTRLSVIKFGML